MGPLIAGLAALVVLLLLLRSYVYAQPAALAKGFRRSGGILLGLGAVALALTGRIGIAFLLASGSWMLLFGGPPPWAQQNPNYGPGGNAGGGERSAEPPRGSGAMSRAEALRVLGLEAGASEADIRAAHRRLIQQTHPDKGGSTYLAAKINEAKDVLLKGR